MRFLDLDLDFFLNQDAYRSEGNGERLGLEYEPWGISEVRHFLEDRCGLSTGKPVPGRTIESHDKVLDFWRMLIQSGRLDIPFEVVHVDAHPDLWVGNGLHLKADFLCIDGESGLARVKQQHIHPGNFLTFAIAEGWISSLTWVPRLKYLKDLPERSGNTSFKSLQAENKEGDLPAEGTGHCVRYTVLPWHRFKTGETFDYIALSRSPDFTPVESDELIAVVEKYIKQI